MALEVGPERYSELSDPLVADTDPLLCASTPGANGRDKPLGSLLRGEAADHALTFAADPAPMPFNNDPAKQID